MYILRHKKTHRPLALGFSPEGLQFTTDDRGRYIFFKNARTVLEGGKLKFVGDTTMSNDVYVEIYQRRKHTTSQLNSIEQVFAIKARQYGVPNTQNRANSKGLSGARRPKRTDRNS